MAKSHWAEQKELGGGMWQLRLILGFFRVLGPSTIRVLVKPVAFIFFLTAPAKRRYSRQFLVAVAESTKNEPPGMRDVHRHFQSFASSLVDKMSAWAGLLDLDALETDVVDDYYNMVTTLQSGQGVIAMCSHLGNIEMLRALGSMQVDYIEDFRIISIVEFNGTGKFNEIINEINGNSMVDIIPVSDIVPETIIKLRDFVESGGMVVIAGDRVSPRKEARFLELEFFGKVARFPYGSYLLADLLQVPVYSIFAVRCDDRSIRSRYRYHVRKSAVSLRGSRKDRNDRLTCLAGEFRDHLQELAGRYPYQWFNFYHYWRTEPSEGKG